MARLAHLLRKPAGGAYWVSEGVGADEVERMARAARLAFFRVDGRAAAGKRALLDALASALRFPATFGRNWDALADCLGDLSWLPPGGLVLLWDGADALAGAAPADFATALEVLGEAATDWAAQGRPVFVLVRGAGPAPAKLPRATR